MDESVNKDALIKILQAENKNFRLMATDMRELIKSLEESIKQRDKQIEEMQAIHNDFVRRLMQG